MTDVHDRVRPAVRVESAGLDDGPEAVLDLIDARIQIEPGLAAAAAARLGRL